MKMPLRYLFILVTMDPDGTCLLLIVVRIHGVRLRNSVFSVGLVKTVDQLMAERLVRLPGVSATVFASVLRDERRIVLYNRIRTGPCSAVGTQLCLARNIISSICTIATGVVLFATRYDRLDCNVTPRLA